MKAALPVTLACCVGLLNVAARGAAVEPGENLYWPGDFETHLYGGIYSNSVNVEISADANHTPDGGQAWQVGKGYHHLERLVPGHSRYRLTFWAKTPSPLTVKFKVISPGEEPAAEGEKPKLKDRTYEIALKAGEAWQRYTLDFETGEPYPGPIVTEVLFSIWSGQSKAAYIDDLQIQPLVDPEAAPAAPAGEPTKAIVNGDFERGVSGWVLPEGQGKPIPAAAVAGGDDRPWPGHALVLGKAGHPEAAVSSVAQAIDASALAGKRVRVSADVAYLSSELPIQSWSGVLIVLWAGDRAVGEPLEPTPKPFWCPMGLSAPVGRFRTIAAEYDIPADAKSLYLRIMTQNGMGSNLAALDNVSISVPASP